MAASAKPPSIPGWSILGIAGQGGFGIVWRAKRESDGLLAAIKVAPPSDLSTIERIEEEASALRALEHPHIVRLVDSGPLVDGGLYLAMEYLPGDPLAHRIPLHGFPPAEALRLFRPIAQAVGHAHSYGILHRDLKPANILFAPAAANEAPTPKVADFGLARPIQERTQALSLTATGIIAGTAEYLPPEAYRSDYRPAPTADIYALGIILHELLVGAPPRGAWRPIAEQKRVDIRIDDLLRRALHPEPARRFPTVATMLAALEEIERTSPRYAGTPRITRATRAADAVWTLLGLGVLLAAMGVILRIALIQWEWPVDLVGKQPLRLGGFQSLTLLLPLLGAASLWQIVRLFRFRSVPLREALPSPLGLRMRTGRTAAVIVFFTQLVCFILPLFALLEIWLETGRDWLHRSDGSWRTGLVLTFVNTSSIIDPWSWEYFPDAHWMWEHTGPPGHPLSRSHGREDFIPGFTPWLMLSSAVVAFFTLAITLLAAAWRWGRWKKWRAVFPLLILGLLVKQGAGIWKKSAKRIHPRPATELNPHTDPHPTIGQLQPWLYPTAKTPPIPEVALSLYAPEVEWRDAGKLTRAEVATRIAADAAAARTEQRAYDGFTSGIGRHPDGTLRGKYDSFVYRQPPDAPATGEIWNLVLEAQDTPDRGFQITRETLQKTPIYTAESRPLPEPEADAWLGQFTGALTWVSPVEESLTQFFHPTTFQIGTAFRARLDEHGPRDRALLIASLREYRAQVGAHIQVLRKGAIQPMPGARQRIQVRIDRNAVGHIADWTLDLIHTGGRWQIFQFSYTALK